MSINPILFGQGQTHAQRFSPRIFFAEWVKGDRIIQWMKQQAISAVFVIGLHRHGESSLGQGAIPMVS